MALSGIELLDDTHRPDAFDCGKPVLNAWLSGFARTNRPEVSPASWPFTTSETLSAITVSRQA